MMRRTTVLIADDHAIVSEGLAALLTKHDFEVVGTVRDGHALIDAAKRLRPDVIVTDLSMPGLSGLDVLARLKAEHVDSKVIVLTMHDNPDLATVAMRAGASGFLLKDSAAGEVVMAIQQALQGRVYLTPALTRGVMERMAAPGDPPDTPAHCPTTRRLAIDRQGAADEGDCCESGAVRAHGRSAQVRDDEEPRSAFHR